MKPILTAIKTLLEFKGKCTYSEIAKVSKQPQLKVLQVLNSNKKLLKKTDKGEISGLTNSGLLADALKRTKYFFRKKENYNTIDVLNIDDKEFFDKLKEPYVFGMFGDSYQGYIVKDTPENEKILRDAGFKTYGEVASLDECKIENNWQE